MLKNKYIVIEGLDGSGKTTQFENLRKYLGDNAIAVREPGGTEMSEHIRSLLKDKSIPRAPQTNLFLFSAARADLIETIIRPAIKKGETVVSDRCWVSTLAYQSTEGVDPDHVKQLSRLATREFYEPDLLIFLDVDPALCRKRLTARGGAEADYFDTKGKNYFEHVRSVYQNYVQGRKNCYTIDGSGTPSAVWKIILKTLEAEGYL